VSTINLHRVGRNWLEVRGGGLDFERSRDWLGLSPIPGVRVLPAAVTLPVSAWHLPEVREIFDEYGFCNVPDAQREGKLVAESGYWLPQGTLFPHQISGIKFLLQHGGGLLGDQPGLGKTRVAIVAAETLGGSKPRIVIGPKFTRSAWTSELIATGAVRDASEIVYLEGRDITQSKTWRRDARWYFIHFDVAEAWANRLLQLHAQVVIVDEAHYVRTPSAKRTKGTSAIVLPIQHRIVLTGTPLANKPQDLWQLLTLVHGAYSWGSHLAFRQRYMGAINTGYGWQDSDPTHADELRERLSTCYLARTITSAGVQLPSRTRQPVQVDLTEEERKSISFDALDERARREIVEALATGRVGKQAFKLMHELRKHTTRAKISATVDLVDSLLSQGEAVVVFANERATTRAIAGKLTERAFVINGDDEQTTRDITLAAWRSHVRTVGPAALVATYGSLGVGVTLTEARYLVLHDLDWVPSTILQAEARVHRISQTRPVTIYWMTAQDSIDSLFARVLLRKAEYLDTILRDDDARDAFHEANLTKVLPSFEEEVAEYVDEWITQIGRYAPCDAE
jgi:SWI/SNF-related matrix-associated actin-dependent regulator 1 of chromatin subfamily A